MHKKHNQECTGASFVLENVIEEYPNKRTTGKYLCKSRFKRKELSPVQQEESEDVISHLKLSLESDANGFDKKLQFR